MFAIEILVFVKSALQLFSSYSQSYTRERETDRQRKRGRDRHREKGERQRGREGERDRHREGGRRERQRERKRGVREKQKMGNRESVCDMKEKLRLGQKMEGPTTDCGALIIQQRTI